MLYFRLGIYISNCVLGGSFIVLVALSFAFSPPGTNLSLLGGVKWSHPTFRYAYVALFLQFGLLQAAGWLGAWRLSSKILKAYWILLLLFTIFDVIGGAVWVKKLDTVKLSFGQAVLHQFTEKYSSDRSFTSAWNKMQPHELYCCGHSPQDFSNILSSRCTAECALEQQHNDRHVLLPQSSCYYFNSTGQKNTLDQVTDGNVQAQRTNTDSRRARRATHHPRRPGPNKIGKTCSEISGGSFHESSQSGGLSLGLPPHLQFRRPTSRKTGSPRRTTTTTAPSTSSSHWICPTPSEEYQSTLDGSEEKAGNKFNIHIHGCQIKLTEWLDDLIDFYFKLFCINCFVQVFCLLSLYYAIRALIIAENLMLLHLSCPRHNPHPSPSFLPGERRDFIGESFATAIFQPSAEEDGERDCGKENNIWLTSYEDDSESEQVPTITASMGKLYRLNDPPQMLAHERRPTLNEPSASHLSDHGQHYNPQHYEFKPIPNLSLKPETMGPSVFSVKPKCMYPAPALDGRSNTEQQQPSMGEIGHVSAISPVEEDEEEYQCNIFLCCAYTEVPEC